MMVLDGKVALISGGASGLGAETARTFAAKGAKVAVFDIDPEKGQAVANDIGGVFARVDVSDEAQVLAGYEKVESSLGTASILVNCAGIAPNIPIISYKGDRHPLDAYRRTIEVNQVGTFLMCSLFAHRAKRGSDGLLETGVIVNVASIAAFEGQEGHAAYASSKGGVIAMTLPLARELGRFGIRVVAIAPGIFDTPMMDSVPRPDHMILGSQVPFPKRLGKPEEFARLVLSVVENRYVNGITLRLDGGLRLLHQ